MHDLQQIKEPQHKKAGREEAMLWLFQVFGKVRRSLTKFVLLEGLLVQLIVETLVASYEV